MCTRAGAPARSFTAATPTAPAAQAAPTTQASAQPTRPSRLVSDTGVQDMDDATLTALITRAMRAPRARDGRDDTIAQRIADALGISQQQPESVRQEALASRRGTVGDAGTLYRTVSDARDGSKTARQIAHELTDEQGNFGYNFGGGRAYGVGIYFAGSVHGRSISGANSSAAYGRGRNAYTIEAALKPGARIATMSTVTGRAAQRWALAHAGALRAMGMSVSPTGKVTGGHGMSADDRYTTLAMLMGYDGYREATTHPYWVIFNRGALQVARGNKYDRASNGTL